MRPIDIGSVPLQQDGTPVTFQKYQEAKDDLLKRIGEYCVFCERRCVSDLAVEHKLPKDLFPQRILDWINFVVACRSCNSTKGTKDTNKEWHLFSDEVNTAYAFLYQENNIIIPNPLLSPNEQAAAERTLRLVGLEKREVNRGTRYFQRGEIWHRAKYCRQRVLKNDTPETWEYVVEIAELAGFWSVWMTVFADHAEIRKLLIQRFIGTRSSCFDDEGNCHPRLGI